MRTACIIALAAVAPRAVRAWSFAFTSKPTQCGRLTVTVDGGSPPYHIVMVPSGPLPNGQQEIRTIVDQQFDSSPYTLPPLNFPGNSNFTTIVGDSNGVGTGGTSVITDVASSNNDSCLSTTQTTPLFYLILPNNPTLTQCGSMDITFSDSAQGQVSLMAVIPGGESFSIPVPNGQRSTTWSPIRVPAGTGLMFVAGDQRGRGTGGSSYLMVVQGGSDDCLKDGQEVYSATPSPYAGGQYATGSGGGTVTGPWQNGPSGTTPPSGSNTSASHKRRTGIIAGVVCGVLAILVLCAAIYLWRRRRARKERQYGGTKEVDLLRSERPVVNFDTVGAEPIPYYSSNNAPSATANSRPTTGGAAANGHRPSTSISTTNAGDRQSTASHDPLVPPSAWNNHAQHHSPYHRSSTPSGTGYQNDGTDMTSTGASSDYQTNSPTHLSAPAAGTFAGATRQDVKNPEGPGSGGLRPVNVIQHQDAGGVPPTNEPEEVVELPPSYNEVRRIEGGPSP
ncbi:SubName: Full=Uncharacterized protein {ECO:0000313/EMBL:CCA67286.1} [Serendipita indica DSM 11827]|nr:SubName: Full=Uncharacterized protein {ECO:0000313/EMBL:CCA67286.1} [Serendipita indica DSM 11827]